MYNLLKYKFVVLGLSVNSRKGALLEESHLSFITI